MGAHASWFGSCEDNEGTCLAPNSHGRTRRDYVIANPAARNHVTGFHIIHANTGLLTHSVLQLKMSPANEEGHKMCMVEKHLQLEKLFEDSIDKEFPNLTQADRDKKKKEETEKLHTYMDNRLRECHSKLQECHERKDADGMLTNIYKAIEEAFIE